MAGAHQGVIDSGAKSAVVVNYLLSGIDQATSVSTTDPADGDAGWTALEALCHMVDWELVLQERIGQILSGKGESLAQFDPQWPITKNYRGQNFAEKAAERRALRIDSLTLLSDLADQDWLKTGVHATRGTLSVLDLASGMASHDLDHLDQIVRTLSAE